MNNATAQTVKPSRRGAIAKALSSEFGRPQSNHPLAALPAVEWARWLPQLEAVELPLGFVLYESGQAPPCAQFPTTAIVSLLFGDRLHGDEGVMTQELIGHGLAAFSVHQGSQPGNTMKLLFAADGSECTKRALAFLITHEGLAGPDDELLVLNIQPAMPQRVSHAVGADVVKDFHRDEADKVLDPIKAFLDRHPVRFRCEWRVGTPAAEIIDAAQREKSHMIVMGTHGHGLVGSMLLGSVAQRVVAACHVPVLLVK